MLSKNDIRYLIVIIPLIALLVHLFVSDNEEQKKQIAITYTEDEICRIKKSLQEHRDIYLKRCDTVPDNLTFKDVYIQHCTARAMEEFRRANEQTLKLVDEHNVLFHLSKCE